MHPETNFRNPWISQMLQQQQTESENSTSLENAFIHKSTTTTIQAVVALAAGVASVRNDLCQVNLD